MKKYLLLLIVLVLISCSEDDDKKDILTFNGTETYVFVSENEDVQVFDINGEITDPMLWDSSLVEAKLEFDSDETYNYTGFKINNDYIYLTNGIETDTIPILIEDNKIYTDGAIIGFKIKIFDILDDGVLQNSAVMFYSKTIENDVISINSESTNFSYTEYDEQFNEAKLNLDENTTIALIKQKRNYNSAGQ